MTDIEYVLKYVLIYIILANFKCSKNSQLVMLGILSVNTQFYFCFKEDTK